MSISQDTARRVALSVEVMRAIRDGVGRVCDGTLEQQVSWVIQVYCAMLIAETTR